MPGFSHEEISNQDMNDLLAYIRASRLSGPPYGAGGGDHLHYSETLDLRLLGRGGIPRRPAQHVDFR